MSPVRNLKPDGNCVCIIIRRAIVELHCECGHFHMMMVVSTRNVSKQAHDINKLSALGTSFIIAPVLFFELHLAINHSSDS